MKPKFLYANGLRYYVTAETELSYIGRLMNQEGGLFDHEIAVTKKAIGKTFFLTEAECKDRQDRKAKYKRKLKKLKEKYGI